MLVILVYVWCVTAIKEMTRVGVGVGTGAVLLILEPREKSRMGPQNHWCPQSPPVEPRKEWSSSHMNWVCITTGSVLPEPQMEQVQAATRACFSSFSPLL